MRRGWSAVCWMSLACFGCGAGSLSPDAASATGAIDLCAAGAPLSGATYDLARSRFVFGSTPTRMDEFGLVRWVGDHGVVAIEPSGGEIGEMNGGAPEVGLPDWSSDPAALEAHARAYFASFGVASCQAPSAQVLDGSSGRTISLLRSVDGINIGESSAYARFNSQDQSTSEGFYWPMIPADVVTSARALHERLADPAQLAAYKTKLPTDAQGDGVVNLHHTSAASTSPFAAAATYDVYASGGQLGLGSTLSFDADGNPVANAW
jgi:hypothetical protein